MLRMTIFIYLAGLMCTLVRHYTCHAFAVPSVDPTYHLPSHNAYLDCSGCFWDIFAALTMCKLWAIDRQSFQSIMMKTGLQRQAEYLDLLRRSVQEMKVYVLKSGFLFHNVDGLWWFNGNLTNNFCGQEELHSSQDRFVVILASMCNCLPLRVILERPTLLVFFIGVTCKTALFLQLPFTVIQFSLVFGL